METQGRTNEGRKRKRRVTKNDYPHECIVLKHGKPLMYEPEEKFLFLTSGFTVFTSKHKAKIARWHTVQKNVQEGKFGTVTEYSIEET